MDPNGDYRLQWVVQASLVLIQNPWTWIPQEMNCKIYEVEARSIKQTTTDNEIQPAKRFSQTKAVWSWTSRASEMITKSTCEKNEARYSYLSDLRKSSLVLRGRKIKQQNTNIIRQVYKSGTDGENNIKNTVERWPEAVGRSCDRRKETWFHYYSCVSV